MGLFDNYKKKEIRPNFSKVDTTEKVIELEKKGILSPLYLMPLKFNGEASERNRLFVPPFAVELKDRCDHIVETLFVRNKVNGYSCTPTYKGKSFVPSQVTVIARKDDKDVFTYTLRIW